ncbi:MAG: IS66 family insertion sequence element accessory protein TnpA [Bryobacteraceae bacterium]
MRSGDPIVVEMKETTAEQRTTSRIDYWREQVAQQERSELPVKQFCEKHGITEQSFYTWRKRLRKQPSVRFALVETTPGEQEMAGDASVELIFSKGERLRIGRGTDLALLRRVVEVLRG